LFVCYDLRFADEMWALAHDTDCYVLVANWPESRRHHWRTLLVARAIENQAYVVGVNRVGEGDGIAYVGDSRIVDPSGEILASAARTEALVVADVDPAEVARVRERFPFLADRR
jgi:predicted amidohydrolase